MLTSVTNLYPLELDAPSLHSDDDSGDSPSHPSSVNKSSSSHSRPVRRAASQFKDKFKTCGQPGLSLIVYIVYKYLNVNKKN